MAKNFPYFKFVATEWMTGDIAFEELDLQGLFINICALYWQRDGKLSIDDINKRLKKPELLNQLADRFISVSDGFISIKFLDEQLQEANHISKVNSENGKKGGRPPKSTDNKEEKTDRFTKGNRNETEKKQSKEEEEEELNKSKLNSDKEIFEKLKFDLFNSPSWLEDISRNNNIQIQKVKMYLTDFCKKLEDEQDYFKELKEQKKHFVNWMKIQINKPTSKFAPAETPKRLDYSIADLNKKPLKD